MMSILEPHQSTTLVKVAESVLSTIGREVDQLPRPTRSVTVSHLLEEVEPRSFEDE
jgi:hypothetical protein